MGGLGLEGSGLSWQGLVQSWVLGWETLLDPSSEAGGLIPPSGGCKNEFRLESPGLAPLPGLNLNFPEGLGLDPASKTLLLEFRGAAKLS